MSSIKDKLIDWVTEMENYRMPNWNDLLILIFIWIRLLPT